mmetsp:Transcript_16873/g.48480  ORF Transcript_16873/g.48480 Transcript_16873/m.48480 type:complete len:954 (-) Transcript_16873:111-2972(-)
MKALSSLLLLLLTTIPTARVYVSGQPVSRVGVDHPLAGTLGNTLILTREPDDGSVSADAEAIVLAIATAAALEGEGRDDDDDKDVSSLAHAASSGLGRVCDYDGGILTLSHPHSLNPTDRHFVISNLFLRAYEMAVDRINSYPRCGVSAGGRRYGFRLRSYGIESNPHKSLAASRFMEPTTDFFLGPYTSALTDQVSEVAHDAHKVLVAPASYLPAVVQDRPGSFAATPPPGNYLREVIPMLAASTDARTVRAVYEPGGPGAQCRALPDLAAAHGLVVTGMDELPPAGRRDADHLPSLARNMSRPEQDPDVVVTCTFEAGCVEWMAALRAARWSPRAQVFSVCVGLDTFEAAVGTDAEYLLGMSPWVGTGTAVDVVDGAANWTSEEFVPLFETYSGRAVTYHAALGVAAVSSLVQAIERADSLETDQVANELQTGVFPTLFGNVRFDADGQNDMNLLALQYSSTGRVGVVYPPERKTAELVYPMPTFDERDCVHLSPCGAGARMARTTFGGDEQEGAASGSADIHANANYRYAGTCLPDGTCECASSAAEQRRSIGLGSTAACHDVVSEDMNYIAPALKATGYALFALQLFASLALAAWTFRYRNRAAVKAAQPIFLGLILIGAAVLCSSIVPMGFETSYRYLEDPASGELTETPNADVRGVDAACMAVPWLVVLGFVIAYSALFAKSWRIKKIYDGARAMRRVTINPKDVAFIMATLLSVAVTILVTWQLVAPLKWEREVLAVNELGEATESIGRCRSDGAVPFLIVLAVFMFGCLLFALYLSYVTRSIPSDLNEGKWVTASIVSIFQILLLAVPVLVIVFQVSSDAYYFVQAAIVFLIGAAVTSFVFGPKLYALHVTVLMDNQTGDKTRSYNFRGKIRGPSTGRTSGASGFTGSDGGGGGSRSSEPSAMWGASGVKKDEEEAKAVVPFPDEENPRCEGTANDLDEDGIRKV